MQLLSPMQFSNKRHLTTHAPSSPSPISIPHLQAPDVINPHHHHQQTLQDHAADVAKHLHDQGILKVTLATPDPSSQYLHHLITALHHHHAHQLPISHSASRGWFWDVRPAASECAFQTANHQARSETMDEFPWHTDCSYEDPTPRFFALQVLQHDRHGGGTLSLMNVRRLTECLSAKARSALSRPEFRIGVPREFIKQSGKTHIIANLLSTRMGRIPTMRFRDDITTALTSDADAALAELRGALHRDAEARNRTTVHLTAEEMPAASVVLVDNRRWLHARNEVRDPERHLRRVRWDAVPF